MYKVWSQDKICEESKTLNEIPVDTMERLRKLADKIEESLNGLIETTAPITEKHVEEYEAKWPIEKQYLKIYEETGEAEKAHTRNLDTEDEEHMDIQFSLLTLMHFRKKSRGENKIAILKCLIKFHRRGWI